MFLNRSTNALPLTLKSNKLLLAVMSNKAKIKDEFTLTTITKKNSKNKNKKNIFFL